MNTQCIVAEYSFYSSDEYIRCLCADQSGKKSMKLVRKLDEVDKKAQESYIVCVD